MRQGDTPLDKEIRKIQTTVDEVKSGLVEKILALPDNPRINRCSDNPSSFTISSPDFGKCWSVEHHDFKTQHERLAQIVSKTEFWNIVPKLKEIIRTGRHQQIHFHPDVIEQLKEILDIKEEGC